MTEKLKKMWTDVVNLKCIMTALDSIHHFWFESRYLNFSFSSSKSACMWSILPDTRWHSKTFVSFLLSQTRPENAREDDVYISCEKVFQVLQIPSSVCITFVCHFNFENALSKRLRYISRNKHRGQFRRQTHRRKFFAAFFYDRATSNDANSDWNVNTN